VNVEEPPVWLDGGLMAAAEARISVFDRGLTVGDGVFETIKVAAGVPFALTRHLDRLGASATAMGLVTPREQMLREAAAAVCRGVAHLDLARLRITLTSGPGPIGSARIAGRTTLLVTAAPFTARAGAESVVVVPWRRNEHGATTGVKTTSYAENVVALAAAHRAGAGEALLVNTAGELCEGTGSNVFCVLDGVAVTPPLSSGCLAGVTRALVLAWYPDAVERVLDPGELRRAEEVFLTASTRGVQAVEAVDGMRPGGPAAMVPGPVTRAVAAAYAAGAARDPDPR